MAGFHTGIGSGGGNFVSGEQWACKARLPRGDLASLLHRKASFRIALA